MQVAPDILLCDEAGEGVVACGFDLAPVFAQFRFDVAQSDGGVDLLFTFTRDCFVPFEDAVFVEFESLVDGDFAQSDGVAFGAGEVLECGTVAFLFHDAQIDLQGVLEDDGRACRTGADHFDYLVKGDEVVDHLFWCVGGAEDIQIADRLLAPAKTSGYIDGVQSRCFLQIGFEIIGVGFRFGEEKANSLLFEQVHPFEDILFRFGAKTRKFADLVLFSRFFERFGIGDV